MSEKHVDGECNNCESSFHVAFARELVSQDLPEHCPFCGSIIEDVTESFVDDEDDEIEYSDDWN